MENFSHTQTIHKHVIPTRGGVVAAQHRKAAEAGAAVLEAGGDAVDAAVATSFALGVVEPWMSGPGGGGAMVLWRAAEQRAQAVSFGLRAPQGLRIGDYPLISGERQTDLFGWRAVLEDRNVQGPLSIAVPGVVAGMGLAHARYGRLPWRDLLAPAAGLAQRGLAVDWYASLIIGSTARALAADPDAAAIFLDDGLWPIAGSWTGLQTRRLDQSAMAATLQRLGEAGARDFYEGDIARTLVQDIQAKGGRLSLPDLAGYQATHGDALPIPYRGGQVHAAPGLTAGPTLAQCLAELQRAPALDGAQPGPAHHVAYARALRAAYQSRLAEMGDGDAPHAPSCTTHFSVVDRAGNLCSVTQTLLSIFGSRVVSPSTGLLLNNGIMWFDPEPGKPNSLAAGKRCLMNVCPVVGQAPDGRRFAVGASGGRKIVGAVAQLCAFLIDHGMPLEDAFHQPRIDASNSDAVVADVAMAPETLAALAAAFPLVTARRTVFPYAFGCPAGVLRDGDSNSGCTETMSPWGDAVNER